MRKKYIITVLFLLVSTSFLFALQKDRKKNINWTQVIDDNDPIDNSDAKIILVAKSTCKIGELVLLDASQSRANSFTWHILPDTPNFRVIDNGQKALFCSGESGEYLFVLSVSKRDTIDCVIHKIVVEGNPIPADAFTATVKSWLPKTKNAIILEKLARSFERVASAGHTDIAVFVKTTALSNRGTLGVNLEEYKPFLISFSGYLKENYSNKPIHEHIELWFKMASTLRSLK